MREAKARHVSAIFDSCFSGGVFNVARSAPPPAVTLATTQPVRSSILRGQRLIAAAAPIRGANVNRARLQVDVRAPQGQRRSWESRAVKCDLL